MKLRTRAFEAVFFLRFFSALKPAYPELRLRLVGDGPIRRELEALAAAVTRHFSAVSIGKQRALSARSLVRQRYSIETAGEKFLRLL